jgi:hypothetical protein
MRRVGKGCSASVGQSPAVKLLAHGDHRRGMVVVGVSRDAPDPGRGGGRFQHPVLALIEPLCRPYARVQHQYKIDPNKVRGLPEPPRVYWRLFV